MQVNIRKSKRPYFVHSEGSTKYGLLLLRHYTVDPNTLAR